MLGICTALQACLTQFYGLDELFHKVLRVWGFLEDSIENYLFLLFRVPHSGGLP